MTTLQTISASVSPEVSMNENFDALSAVGVYGKKATTTFGLQWGYYGGIYNSATVADGTVALTGSTTNYVVVNRFTGAVSVATTDTNWNDSAYARMYKLTTSASVVTAIEDHRFAANGLYGQTGLPMQSKSAAYGFVLADANTGVLHPSADTTARTFTIPANSSVPYPIGTALTVINQHSAGVVTIAITTDTMRLAGAGTTGSRTLAADGIATALKLTATEWLISGTGLT